MTVHIMLKKITQQYGMLFVLIGLCSLFSVLTLKEQMPTGQSAVNQIFHMIQSNTDSSAAIIAVGEENKETATFAQNLNDILIAQGFHNTQTVIGTPRDLRIKLDELQSQNATPAAIATSGDVLKWGVISSISQNYPSFGDVKILSPTSYMYPDFLKSTNILAIVDRIVVIAIIAIGMTMVIITGGIDLSVGSLIALSAVIGTLVMKQFGGLEAPTWVVFLGFIVGSCSCGLIGALGGFIVAKFKVAPFITTLSIMMIARGLAYQITGGFSIYQVPDSLTWLGQGITLGIPNTVILLVVLFTVAHIFMAHTQLGRYIYCVGGNQEAARLSGIPVSMVIVFVYTISALMAGLGGCIQASQINTGTPNMGVMYELYVIAAVVVGGTSLSGGSGRIVGTLIGAFIISVIQNGMNLLGIESYTQQVVLGAVILAAVLLDRSRLHSSTS